MKKNTFILYGILSLFFVSLLHNSARSQSPQEVKTVADIEKTKNHDTILLDGIFSSQVDDDEFIFEDTTGKIKVELSKSTIITPNVQYFSDLFGAKVKIWATVSKKWLGKQELKAIQVQVEKIQTQTLPSPSTTVAEVLNKASDTQMVVLEGIFSSQTDDDEFIFEDTTGKIKVEISSQTDISPSIKHLSDLHGARVRIRALVDKELGDATELKATRIEVQKLSNQML